MRTPTITLIRLTASGMLVAAMAALFLLRPGVALAHHIEIEATNTCNTFEIRADYVGGSSDRYAEVWVNGVLAQTVQFPGSGPDFIDDFFVLAGALPTATTVEVRLYVPQAGPDHLESTVSATVDEDDTCTPTATPTSPTNTPVASATSTPEPTDTPAATQTPPPTTSTPTTPSPSPTNVPPTPLPATATTAPPTSTPATAATPTFVSTVEALLPPGQPGTGGTPPEETASGLPNAGSGSANSGIALGLALVTLAAGGLTLSTMALRRRDRGTGLGE